MEYAQSGQSTRYSNVATGRDVPGDPPIATPIRDGVTNAEQNLSTLHDVIAQLERRLETVLRPLPPSTVGVGKESAPPPCSHVMGRLHILNDGLGGAIARLRELENRVEV